MATLSDLHALVVQQSTLITSLLAEVAALKEQVNGSPANTVLSTADQASLDAMDEALTASIASLSAAQPAPEAASEPAPAETASEPETPAEAASEPSESVQEPTAE